MAAITAQSINELRQRTGLGMNKCKELMTKANGDMDEAIKLARAEGVKESLTSRATTEGRLYVAKAADGKSGAIVEVLCNTDFTAKSEPIAKVLKAAAETLLANPKADLNSTPAIKDALVAVAQSTGENVTLGRTKVVSNPAGVVGTYLYTVTNKIGVLVSLTGNASDEVVGDLAMHITAFKPIAMGLTRDAVPADLVAKEKEVAVEAAKATGKPQNIAEKIAEGKMASFFKERVLGEQEFINGDKFKGSVAELLKKHGVTLNEYVRMEVGVA
jgi:elongation factor Ts